MNIRFTVQLKAVSKRAKNKKAVNTVTKAVDLIGGFTLDANRFFCSQAADGYTYTGDFRTYGYSANRRLITISQKNNSTGATEWPFYLSYDGSLVATKATLKGHITADTGQIGKFIIDDGTLTQKGGLYADYIGSTHAYRTFIQPAFYDSQQGTSANTWCFSVQHADVTNGKPGKYTADFYVTSSGQMYLRDNAKFDSNLTVNGALNVATKIIADALNISTVATINNITLTTGQTTIGTNTANRQIIMSKGGFVINANNGANALYFCASSVNVLSKMNCEDDVRIKGEMYLNYSSSQSVPVYMAPDGRLHPQGA